MRIKILAIMVAIMVLAVPRVAQAGGVVGSGTPASCTESALKSAISSSGTVTFNCGGPKTITLSSPLLFQDHDVTIDGGNLITLTATAGNRVVQFQTWGFNAAQTVELRNLTIQGASISGSGTNANGAAIHVINQAANYPDDEPTLIIRNVTFNNNVAHQTGSSGNGYDFGGGAIYAQASRLFIYDSTFNSNQASRSAGGAIHGLGSDIRIEGTTFNNNSATPYDSGSNTSGFAGAIYVDGAHPTNSQGIQIYDSVFDGNSGHNSGGAMYINLYPWRNSFLWIVDSVYRNNRSEDGLGGAISGGGTGGAIPVEILNTRFENNSILEGNGGAVAFAQPTNTNITNTVFVGNRAEGTLTSGYSGKIGGALYIGANSTVDIANSTFAANYASWVAGAITMDNSSSGTVLNTIFAQNFADNGSNNWGIELSCSDTLTGLGGNLQDEGTKACATGVTVSSPGFVTPPSDGGDGWPNLPNTGPDESANNNMGNIALQQSGAAVNAGTTSNLPADTFDIDGDGNIGEALPGDIEKVHRVWDGVIDSGAYEYTGYSFIDVPYAGYPPVFGDWIEDFYEAGITTGCGIDTMGNLRYCPSTTVDRGQMAIFILRAMNYDSLPYTPTGIEPNPFMDVPSPNQPAFFENWIEEFYQEGITTGCAGTPDVDLQYCPDEAVNRGAMAVFLLRALYGGGHTPTGIDPNPFADVPSINQPPFFEDWIEEFYSLGITTGCATSPLRYCPEDPVNRAAMAVFILRAFDNIPDPNDP